METDSVAGDVDCVHAGPSPLDPLVDAVSQQQGWLRVYGKTGSGSPGVSPLPEAEPRGPPQTPPDPSVPGGLDKFSDPTQKLGS